MAVWFTSDFHLGHANIIKYSGRPFATVDEMDNVIINNVNRVVMPDDRLYFLGDWCMPGRGYFAEVAKRYRDRIACKTITYIWGNHDKKGRGNAAFMRLFDGCYDLLEVDIGLQKIVLCHYAMRVWNKSHRGAWHLYGHSHASLPDDPNALSADCGIDAAAIYLTNTGVRHVEDYRPLSVDEIARIMAKKTWKPVDHHGAE